MEVSQNNTIICNICLTDYDEEVRIPKVILCGHTLCHVCYQEMAKEEQYRCPFCKKVFKKKDPAVNYEILAIVQSRNLQNACPKHTNELLNFYCKDDKILICQYCLLDGHIGHSISKPEDSEISTALTQIKEFKEFEKHIRDRKFNSNIDIKHLLTKIDDAFVEFTNLSEKIKNLIKYEYVHNYKLLTSIKNIVMDIEASIDKEYEAIKTGKKTGIEEELLTKYKLIQEQYGSIKISTDDLNKNPNFLSYLGVIENMKTISQNIRKEVDLSEIQKPQYSDIENAVEYLMENKPSTIRYFLNNSSTDHKKLTTVAALKTVCTNEHVINLMKSIDRKDFMRDSSSSIYIDSAAPIGWNTTISAPHMHIITLNHLAKYVDSFSQDLKGIDIGCGSGYMTLAISKLLGPNSTVIGLDHINEIIEFSRNNIRKKHKQYLDSERIKLIVADGYNGYEAGGSYDIIHVGAAVEEIPQALVGQLKIGGVMWIPVGPKGLSKKMFLCQKDSTGSLKKTELMAVNYAEMTTSQEQLNGTSYNLPFFLMSSSNHGDDSDGSNDL